MQIDLLNPGLNGKTNQFLFGVSTLALITGGKKTVLFDSGPYRMRGALKKALRDHGLTEDDVDIVFISHVHWDHVMNVDLFRNSTIYMPRAEYEFANNLPEDNWAVPPFLNELLAGLRLEFLDNTEVELLEGVKTILLPGHSIGLQGLVVETDQGKSVLASDAVWSSRSVLKEHPKFTFYDMALTEASVEKVVQTADVIYPGHDRPFRFKEGKVQFLADATYHFNFQFDPSGEDFPVTVSSNLNTDRSAWFTS